MKNKKKEEEKKNNKLEDSLRDREIKQKKLHKKLFSFKNKKEGFKSSKSKNQKKVEKNNSFLSKKVKKHHVWGLGGIIVGIIIALLIVTLFSVKFITSLKTDSYIEGGRDALREVFNSVSDKGGLILNFEGESIIIARYNKETNVGDSQSDESEEIIPNEVPEEEPPIEEPKV